MVSQASAVLQEILQKRSRAETVEEIGECICARRVLYQCLMTAGEPARPLCNILGLYLTPPSAHLPSRLTHRGASREAEQICAFLTAARCNGTPVKPNPITAPADTGLLYAAHNHTHTQACSPPLNLPPNPLQPGTKVSCGAIACRKIESV